MSKDWWEPLVTYNMTFVDEHVEPILDGEKTLTTRLDLEWRHVFDRDALRLFDEDGELIAKAIVKRARTLRLDEALHVVNAHSGHKSYDGVDELWTAMQEYYPDVTIYKNTDLRLVHFEVVDGGG